jgi:hypothetical protein
VAAAASDTQPVQTAQAKDLRSPIGRIDEQKVLKVIPDDRKSGESRMVRPGRTGDQTITERENTATIRPDEVGARTPEARSEGAGGRGVASGPVGEAAPKSARREDRSRSVERGSVVQNKDAPERKVGGKTFRLTNGIWTDKDYKAEKELPFLTLVKDSEAYNEHLAREPRLRAYLAGFSADEPVIVIYKNIVFKLTPKKKDN